MHLFRSSSALALAAILTFSFNAQAQRPAAQPNAAEILHSMQKLNVLGSVLYIAAHPDDENTRLITWLANGKKVRTGYLSLTRGEGGQNLIGPELGDALGIIRTQELLEARRIDGGEQFFTRAVDFGFSKNAAESFEKWGKQNVLSDVVRVIRMFRPDVIITRFPPTRDAGHGHHEASAILAAEAFDLAGDPKAFPEQLEQGLEVWQPRRLFFNGSTFWKKDLAEYVKKDTVSDWYTVDVGGYDPLLGLSYTEIAGRSRSMHKSQGFGAAETRGEMIEYLKLEKGDKPSTRDIFDGIDMTWRKLSPSADIQAQTDKLISGYDVQAPDASTPGLMELHRLLSNRDKSIDPQHWLDHKIDRVRSLLLACNGLIIEALAPTSTVVAARNSKVQLIATNRGSQSMSIIAAGNTKVLEKNRSVIFDLNTSAPEAPDVPFWLEAPHNELYTIEDRTRIGKAVLPNHFTVSSSLVLGDGTIMECSTPVQYRTVDRVKGEVTQPCHVVPFASVHAGRTVVLMPKDTAVVDIGVQVFADSLSGRLHCDQPEGWMVAPMDQSVSG
ncbi:MAG TPA: PIG-L family deacetylase, partial [Flavobacteriales bacterium]|nr:PIG-L family deacetylase [Flavobacteriales bacterium]